MQWKAALERLLRYKRHSRGEVWGRFMSASTTQPTTYLGGQPERRLSKAADRCNKKKPLRPYCKLKGDSMHCPQHSNPQHLLNKMPHARGMDRAPQTDQDGLFCSLSRSQNRRGWKGPLEIILSNSPDIAGSPTAGCTGPCPGGTSAEMF